MVSRAQTLGRSPLRQASQKFSIAFDDIYPRLILNRFSQSTVLTISMVSRKYSTLLQSVTYLGKVGNHISVSKNK